MCTPDRPAKRSQEGVGHPPLPPGAKLPLAWLRRPKGALHKGRGASHRARSQAKCVGRSGWSETSHFPDAPLKVPCLCPCPPGALGGACVDLMDGTTRWVSLGRLLPSAGPHDQTPGSSVKANRAFPSRGSAPKTPLSHPCPLWPLEVVHLVGFIFLFPL